MPELLESDSALTSHLTVLFVSPNDEDCAFLKRVFKSEWVKHTNSECTLIACRTLSASLAVLRERSIPVVLCEGDLYSGTWRGMLDHISHRADAPMLVLTSRLADEHLWAEALRLGAYDVLAKPFDAMEVVRIVNFAWHQWQDRQELATKRTEESKVPAGQLTGTTETGTLSKPGFRVAGVLPGISHPVRRSPPRSGTTASAE
jgi:DNA-binding NtrC family response regulator